MLYKGEDKFFVSNTIRLTKESSFGTQTFTKSGNVSRIPIYSPNLPDTGDFWLTSKQGHDLKS